MESIRKWFYKPRRDDTSLLAQFFYADEALNLVAAELDSFDGRKDQERCTSLVNHLRQCQDKVLTICNHIMDELIPNERADRDFRVKFPDDVMQDNLSGQLWFGAECLAAGSNIMNREAESGAMRPLAKALTKSLENVRNLLREASMRTHPPSELTHDRLIESLKMFDRLLADFELCYVSAMVPVKSVHEYQLQQDVVVLFSETLERALKLNLLTQEMVDQCDPALMFTIPRLAIVTGLLVYPQGPLNIDAGSHNMSEMFRPFKTLLVKIRELLWSLTESELLTLEKMLCSSEDSSVLAQKHSILSEGNGEETSEEESSCWGGEGETSECETVVEKLPSSETDPDLNNQSSLDDSGVNSSESPVANNPSSPSNIIVDINPIEEDQRTIEELGTLREELGNYLCAEEDEISEDANSSTLSLSGGLALTGQWALPIIPCACSVELSEDATMTKQGLMNRSVSLQQEAEFMLGNDETICEECLKQNSDIEVPSDVKPQSGVEEVEDVRWPEPGPSECDTNKVLESVRQSDSDSVQSNSDIINSDDNVNYKQNVSLSEGLRTVDGKRESEDWKKKQVGEVSGDLHVRYAENWEALCSSGQLPDSDKRQVDDRAESLTSSCSSYHSTFSVTSDSRSLTSETSSFNSECQDDEEVALALRAAQDAAKDEARAKFRSSGDLLQRLFVCISGVADQLQTNFAGDLRHILKSVFLMSSSDCYSQAEESNQDVTTPHNSEDVSPELCENGEEALVWGTRREEGGEMEEEEDEVLPPLWLPDEAAPFCLSCMAMFTVIRRRHHCRNCGLVYCARCSSNSVPLPRFGHIKPVRVCDRCFNYHFSSHTSSIETH